jgi:sulfatase maturation enzyme AslB (radical SAM superfamily)
MIAVKVWQHILEHGFQAEAIRKLVADHARLFYLDVDVTGVCPLKCPYCIFHPENFKDAVPLDWEKLEISLREAVDLGISKITVTGKEPLSSPRSLQVLRLLNELRKNHNFQFGLITNGLYAARLLDQVREIAPDFIDFSLDGPEQFHDSIRGKGNFNKALNAIECYSAAFGNAVSISMVVQEENATSLPDMICKFPSANNFYLSPVIPTTYYNHSVSSGTMASLVTELRSALTASRTERSVYVQLFPRHLAYAVKSGIVSLDAMEVDGVDISTVDRCGESRLTLGFQVFPYDFWGGARISVDGFYLPSCMFLSTTNYKSLATGRVSEKTLAQLHAETLAEGSLFHRMLQQWERSYVQDRLKVRSVLA